MNLMKDAREDYSISHFARANSFELSGQELYLVMDDGYNCILKFDGKKCISGIEGQETHESEYMCFKADDTTYLVTFEISEKENHAYVIDMEQRLVTRLICKKGVHPVAVRGVKVNHFSDPQE